MKKSLLKISFISILSIIICGSAFGGSPWYPCRTNDGEDTTVPYEPGTYVDTCIKYICTVGHYCPDSGSAFNDRFNINLYPCPSNYDNTATGLTSIEECCLNGYDSGTGLCVESSEPTPSRTPRRIAKDETSPECDDTTLGAASGTTDFEADWTANTINITWDGNGATVSGGATTCTYDKSFNLPTPPTKTGYNFAGWKVKPLSTLDTSIGGTAYGYTRLNGNTGYNETTYGLTQGSGEWATEFSYGTIKGMAKCSTTSGRYAQTGTPEGTTGRYCWCQTTGFDAEKDGTYMPVSSSSWVFYNDNVLADLCADYCAYYCADRARNYDAFRAALFGLAAN